VPVAERRNTTGCRLSSSRREALALVSASHHRIGYKLKSSAVVMLRRAKAGPTGKGSIPFRRS